MLTKSLRPVRAKAPGYHCVAHAFALTGRSTCHTLTQGAALGYMLLGFQPVSFPFRFRTGYDVNYFLTSSLLRYKLAGCKFAVCVIRTE